MTPSFFVTNVLNGLSPAGTLFGIALTPNGNGPYFVDDGTNTLNQFS
jgi:hypothetical protein